MVIHHWTTLVSVVLVIPAAVNPVMTNEVPAVIVGTVKVLIEPIHKLGATPVAYCSQTLLFAVIAVFETVTVPEERVAVPILLFEPVTKVILPTTLTLH